MWIHFECEAAHNFAICLLRDECVEHPRPACLLFTLSSSQLDTPETDKFEQNGETLSRMEVENIALRDQVEGLRFGPGTALPTIITLVHRSIATPLAVWWQSVRDVPEHAGLDLECRFCTTVDVIRGWQIRMEISLPFRSMCWLPYAPSENHCRLPECSLLSSYFRIHLHFFVRLNLLQERFLLPLWNHWEFIHLLNGILCCSLFLQKTDSLFTAVFAR